MGDFNAPAREEAYRHIVWNGEFNRNQSACLQNGPTRSVRHATNHAQGAAQTDLSFWLRERAAIGGAGSA